MLSFIVSGYLTAWLKERFFLSEEEKITRLVREVISKSQLNYKLSPASLSSSSMKARKIYNIAIRGGDMNNDLFTEMQLFEGVTEI